jgi:sugar phosphate isomerase/epimerase
MKIGLNHDALYKIDKPHSQILAKLKSIGFDSLDYPVYGPWNHPNPIFNQPRENWVKHFQEEKKIIDGEGLFVSQTHATYRPDFDPENFDFFSQKVVDQLTREIEATAILGAKYIVIHPIRISTFYKDKQIDFERNVSEFSKLIPALKQFGVKCALENLFFEDASITGLGATGCSYPEDLLKYANTLGEEFCTCLDTGHAQLLSINPASAVEILGSSLKVLHVNDNDKFRDRHYPVGIGEIDWKEFISALHKVGYQGVFNLELSLGHYLNFSEEALWKMTEYAIESAKHVVNQIEK